jgi:N-acetylmuramoyl-L-alanine amidase
VALDPGHGGADTGARGPTGAIEKDVALALARRTASLLEERLRVVLTRSDDYQIPLRQRAAIANQAGADLFVSLHTGASFLHSARGMTVYYHAPLRGAPAAVPETSAPGNAPVRWDRIQTRHTAASQRLARTLQEALSRTGSAVPCRMLSAPLPLLEGADMPAVLVEVGPITSPTAESDLLSQPGLEALARAIGRGITAYLEQSGNGTAQP